jgi:PAS domain S-box-containing protein
MVEDLRADTRFSGPALLHDHGVVSGMSVIIGEPERPFGVLGAHTRTRRAFTRDDAHFLQAVANVLATAIGRARAEEKLQTLSRAVEQSPALVMITDTEGAIEYVNPRFTEVTGYAAREVIGKNPRLLKSGHTPPEEYECLWETVTSGGTWRGEFYNRKKNGEFYWAAAVISPVHAADGTITHFVGVSEDITERRRREAEVIQASKLATLGEMATAVAHELNQPLSVIRMAAERVIDRLESGEVDRGFLGERMERIASQIERASAIIDHMRIFGRPADENEETFDPRGTVQGVLGLIGEQLRLGDIEVRTDIPKTRLPVVGNEVQLEQVLLNLLTNARDAIEARFAQVGEEEVQARVVAIKVRCSRAKRQVQISVRDTGGGIPDPLRERIFEPFVTTKEKGKGTGLGLSVSRDIVTRMGGTIGARNVAGGAEFTITLPAAQEGESPATQDRAKRVYC